jgi:hypothetical protein
VHSLSQNGMHKGFEGDKRGVPTGTRLMQERGAQRRDAARELKTLRENMTQEVLKTQIEKERAHEHLALILVLPLPPTLILVQRT